MKKFFLIVLIAVLLSTAVFSNGGIPWDFINSQGAKITLTNDKDFHLQKENLEIRFVEDCALVICEYELANVSSKSKAIDFAFNIPVTVGGNLGKNDCLLFYKIFDGEKELPFVTKEEIDNGNPWELFYVVWNTSKLSFAANEVKSLKVFYKVKTNTDAKICAAQYKNNWFIYNLFPAASFGNGKIGELNLTIDKTEILMTEGKIEKISGIELENDNSKCVQHYTFKDFDLNKNRELVIEYDIKGFYIGSYLKNSSKNVRYMENVSATSELVEGKTTYFAKNLNDKDYTTAWVEAANDFGSGEKIHFELNQNINKDQWFGISITHLYLLNGFRKTEKTYYENNRIKKLRLWINGKDGEKSYDITLPDRPYKAINDYNIAYEADLLNDYIDLGRRQAFYNVTSFDIEILEVYPGTKYNDTCISEVIALNVPQPSI